MEEDPFVKLIDVITTLENYNRALCLLSVYLGQRGDSNTIAGITIIYNKLIGEELTPGKVRSLLTRLVSVQLIDRETERLIGKTKVSFHQITPLGILGLLYVMFFLIENPTELAWDQEKFEELIVGREGPLIDYVLNVFVYKFSTPSKIVSAMRSGRDLKKVKLKPFQFEIPKSLSGKGKAFRVFEELLWDHLQYNTGLTKLTITDQLEGEAAGKYLKRLEGLIITEKMGKTEYYRLSTQGVFLLPIIVLLIRELSEDKSILESLMLSKVDSNKNPWIILTHQANHFFMKLYNLDMKL